MITFAKRIRVLAVIFILIAVVLISRLYIVQVVKHDHYINLGDRQYVKKNSVITDRGDIFFTKKDGTYIAAATMNDDYVLYINPKSFYTFISSYKNTSKRTEDDILNELNTKIPSILKLEGEDLESFNSKLARIKAVKNSTYLELFKDLSEEDQVAIKEQLKFDFIGLVKEHKRYYPGNGLASNVIGVIGFQGNELAGRYGIEKQYDDVLSRSSKSYSNFFIDLFSGAKKIISDKNSLEGDVYTTIEPIVQKELEKKVLEINNKQNSELTGAIIMNPYTGEIISMAKVPTFIHNDKKNYPISSYKNDMVESSYEMGSIIKPLTLSVAVDLNKVNSETLYNDGGFVKVKDRTIYNFDRKARGNVNMQTALSQSLNTAFVYITRLVGNDEIKKYFTNFGMREKTGIDLPNESSPLTSNLDKGDVEYANISFGQGLAMSPVGTIKALSVIANGGYQVQPHVVSHIKHDLGHTTKTKINSFENQKPLLKQETVDEVRSMMVYSVDNVMLDGKRKNPRVSIAAKTGTAQMAGKSGGYVDGKNMHTFIGFFPAYKPQFIIFMYTIDPKVSRYASESLASPFMDLTEFLIQYYQIPADR